MKTIKKVASTPLDTTARVIDSFNTGDDKTTNAPSLDAVENGFVGRSEFAILTGDIEYNMYESGVWSLNYPNGFNKNNCVVISCMIANHSENIFKQDNNFYVELDEPINNVGGLNLHRIDNTVPFTIKSYKIMLIKIW